MAQFEWFRRLLGGAWFKVRVRTEHDAYFLWKRSPGSDHVVDIENYRR